MVSTVLLILLSFGLVGELKNTPKYGSKAVSFMVYYTDTGRKGYGNMFILFNIIASIMFIYKQRC